MKNSRAFLSIVAILLVLSLIWTFSGEENQNKHGIKGVFAAVKNKVSGQSQVIANNGEKASESGSKIEADKDKAEAAQRIAQFASFIKIEAQSLDNPQVNTQEKQIILQDRANKLDEVEKNHLKNVSVNPNNPINERILSVYLLSLTSDVASQKIVNDIAGTPLPDFGPNNPHSEAEVRNTQELALRYMAIDKLVENYKSNPAESSMAANALQDLKAQSTQNPVQQVRKYAFDELSKLSVR